MLERAGAEVRVESRADEKYVEVRVAAVIAKWRQQLNMNKINEKFSLPDAPVGSGNAGDPVTSKRLHEWKRTGNEWPWFVKSY
jgi:ribonuclease HII